MGKQAPTGPQQGVILSQAGSSAVLGPRVHLDCLGSTQLLTGAWRVWAALVCKGQGSQGLA